MAPRNSKKRQTSNAKKRQTSNSKTRQTSTSQKGKNPTSKKRRTSSSKKALASSGKTVLDSSERKKVLKSSKKTTDKAATTRCPVPRDDRFKSHCVVCDKALTPGRRGKYACHIGRCERRVRQWQRMTRSERILDFASEVSIPDLKYRYLHRQLDDNGLKSALPNTDNAQQPPLALADTELALADTANAQQPQLALTDTATAQQPQLDPTDTVNAQQPQLALPDTVNAQQSQLALAGTVNALPGIPYWMMKREVWKVKCCQGHPKCVREIKPPGKGNRKFSEEEAVVCLYRWARAPADSPTEHLALKDDRQRIRDCLDKNQEYVKEIIERKLDLNYVPHKPFQEYVKDMIERKLDLNYVPHKPFQEPG